jgi:hypothetical protein
MNSMMEQLIEILGSAQVIEKASKTSHNNYSTNPHSNDITTISTTTSTSTTTTTTTTIISHRLSL